MLNTIGNKITQKNKKTRYNNVLVSNYLITSLPESMNTYRKTLSPTSLNICGNHVYVIVSAIRIVFQ